MASGCAACFVLLLAISVPCEKFASAEATCNTETPCHGCSGEQCELCRDEETVKCCIRDGGSSSQCCATVNPQIQHRPICTGRPTCDTETPCHGCSGEQCELCREEERVNCCIRDGGSSSQCCATVNPQIQHRPICTGRPTCDTETPCHGCSGEQCELCRDEETVKCCIRDGGSSPQCCAHVNPQIQLRPICNGRPTCDTETPCHGCSGEQCESCRDEELVKCCIRDGASSSQCCAKVKPQISFRPICTTYV